MPKRGENIRKRKDGRWEARIIEFYIEGKAHYKSLYGDSYAKVKAMQKEFDKDKIQIEKTPPKKSTGDICDEWLDKIKITIKQSTYATYHRIIHNHIIPYLGSIEPKDITNKTIDKFISVKYELGNGLSAKTTIDIVSVLLQIIKNAEKEKYISDFNYDVCLPKLPMKEFKIMTPAEEQKLNEYLKQNLTPKNFGLILAKETGIRIGELCALKLSDIDLDNATVSISKTIQRIKNFDEGATAKTKIVITEPKSKKSMRVIPLPENIISMARELYTNCDRDTYILTGTKKYIEPRILQKHFQKLMEELKITKITVHSLRHFFATKAVANGFDAKSLSEIMGHASVRFTLEKYVDSSLDLKRSHMNKMASGF